MLNRRQTLGWTGAAGVSLNWGLSTCLTGILEQSVREGHRHRCASVAPENLYPAHPVMHR
jgi:hypothetical protein